MDPHRLLGAEVSLYTGKARAYLRYKAIPFVEVAASREVFKELIVPRTGVRYIPVLISDDDVAVQDTTAIIDFLEARYPQPSVYPETPLQRLVSLLFEVYADEWLVLPAMHFRWNVAENRAFAIREFGKLSMPNASELEQQTLGEQLALPFAGSLPALGVDARTAAAIEASYREFLGELSSHLERQPFLLGTRPSIGDFALFGPLYAHLYRDPASGRLMQREAPRVAAWVERMLAPEPRTGDFLPGDQVPATLEPLLARMFREQGPVLRSTSQQLDAWAATHDEPLPRTLGTHAFELNGARGERRIYPFNLYRFQRPHDLYQELEPASRERADSLLARVGGLDLLGTPLPRRLRRDNNRLQLVEPSTP